MQDAAELLKRADAALALPRLGGMARPNGGGPFLRYNVKWRDPAELLKRAAAALALPRLGGMARPNGVVIVSERRWAFAGVDGSLREGTMPPPPEVLQRLPLARGLVRL